MQSRSFRIDALEGMGASGSGGPEFLIYCHGGTRRASLRRSSINRALALYRRASTGGGDAYPEALLVLQRVGLAISDLTRLLAGLRAAVQGDDAFHALRQTAAPARTQLLDELVSDPAARKAVLGLAPPTASTTCPRELVEAITAAYAAADRQWLDHLTEAQITWRKVAAVSKACRHGLPILPKPLVEAPPGAGALSQGIVTGPGPWAVLPQTNVERADSAMHTTLTVVPLSRQELEEARSSSLRALALFRDLAYIHCQRAAGAEWIVSPKALRALGSAEVAVLKQFGTRLGL